MIETINMYFDNRTDKVGFFIKQLRQLNSWNKEKYHRKDAMFKALKELNYKTFEGRANTYWLTGGIGFSYIYKVPGDKRGQLKEFRGRLIRIVFTASHKNSTMFVAAVVGKNQQGEGFHSIAGDSLSKDFDPRSVYYFNPSIFRI